MEDILKTYLPEILLTILLVINIFFMLSRKKELYFLFLIVSYIFLIISDIISKEEGFIFLIDIGTFFLIYFFYLNEKIEEFCNINFFIFGHNMHGLFQIYPGTVKLPFTHIRNPNVI